ncbi:hypothetical protein ACM66B_000762 [Microbotryomycetes sp. NB124-2]
MPSHTISGLAYLKIVLHAAKYPSSRVIGLLVGPATDDSAVTDAIPMIHHWTDLSIAAEACLQLAEIHCKSRNLTFKGVYVCNDSLDDLAPPAIVVKLANQLAQHSTQKTSLLTVLDSTKLDSDESALIPHSIFASTTSTPKPLDRSSLVLDPVSAASSALDRARAGQGTSLGDFDDYLEDATVDWLENKAIKL